MQWMWDTCMHTVHAHANTSHHLQTVKKTDMLDNQLWLRFLVLYSCTVSLPSTAVRDGGWGEGGETMRREWKEGMRQGGREGESGRDEWRRGCRKREGRGLCVASTDGQTLWAVSIHGTVKLVQLAVWTPQLRRKGWQGTKDQRPSLNLGPMLYCRASDTQANNPPSPIVHMCRYRSMACVAEIPQ